MGRCLQKINEEWADITLLATVILTAAVSFLSISGITNNKNTLPYISSCISIVATIGSIILGLLLKRQHQTKIRDTADDIQEILKRWNHPSWGLEILAILYSLPYALVMWGTLFFLLACSGMFFQDGCIWTYLVIGWVCVMLAVLLICSIVASWEQVEEDKPIPPAPESQEIDETPNVDSQRHSLAHASVNSLPPASPQCLSQLAIEAQSDFLSRPRRSHESKRSMV